MSYKSQYIAATWSDSRAAAIYFDRVLPVDMARLVDPTFDEVDTTAVLASILPEKLLDPSVKIGISRAVILYSLYVNWLPDEGTDHLPPAEALELHAASKMAELKKMYGLLLDLTGETEFSVFGAPSAPVAKAGEGNPCVVLSNIKLIDTSKLSWRHILELRKDPASLEDLRNLRRFIYKDYAGMSEAFIQEDLQSRIFQYEEAAKLWGLPLKLGLLEIAMSERAMGAAGASLALALFGAPLAAIATAAAGGTIAIGEAAIAIARRKQEIELACAQNPVSYLIKLREIQKPDSKL